MANPERDRVCGEVVHFPPATCTRPPGHPPPHQTEVIPEAIAGVAADMLIETERLDMERSILRTERTALRVKSDRLDHQMGRLRIATGIAVVASVVAVVAVVWTIAVLTGPGGSSACIDFGTFCR